MQPTQGSVGAVQLSRVRWHEGENVSFDVPHPLLGKGGRLGILLRLLVAKPARQAIPVVLTDQNRSLEVVRDRRNGDQRLPFVRRVSVKPACQLGVGPAPLQQ